MTAIHHILYCMILLTVAYSPIVMAAPSSNFQNAVTAYKEKRYGEALSQLEKLPDREANKPLVHYYKGLTYQALRQYDKAREQYLWNYKQKADKDLSYKSWQALESMKNMKNTAWSSSTQDRFDVAPADKLGDAKNWSSVGYEGEKEIDPGWSWQRTSSGCGRH